MLALKTKLFMRNMTKEFQKELDKNMDDHMRLNWLAEWYARFWRMLKNPANKDRFSTYEKMLKLIEQDVKRICDKNDYNYEEIIINDNIILCAFVPIGQDFYEIIILMTKFLSKDDGIHTQDLTMEYMEGQILKGVKEVISTNVIINVWDWFG